MTKSEIKNKPRTKPRGGYEWVSTTTYKEGEIVSQVWHERKIVVFDEPIPDDLIEDES